MASSQGKKKSAKVTSMAKKDPAGGAAASIYQLKVTLKGTKPPVWRRIQLAGDTDLYTLHTILQIIMDWDGDHLFQFTAGNRTYSDDYEDFDPFFPSLDMLAGANFAEPSDGQFPFGALPAIIPPAETTGNPIIYLPGAAPTDGVDDVLAAPIPFPGLSALPPVTPFTPFDPLATMTEEEFSVASQELATAIKQQPEQIPQLTAMLEIMLGFAPGEIEEIFQMTGRPNPLRTLDFDTLDDLVERIMDADEEANPVDDDEEGESALDTTTLSMIAPTVKSKFEYEYDFGDSWLHTLLVEKIMPPEEGVQYPICVTGKGACPPEDSGGVWGYYAQLQAFQDPKNPDHEDAVEWLGKDFDPDFFDLDQINKELKPLRKHTKKGKSKKK